jgi:hypothetical protein
MAYSHYFPRLKTRLVNDKPVSNRLLPLAVFRALGRDFQAIARASGVPLANAMGEEGTSPEISDDHLSFNGSGADDSYETFRLSRKQSPDTWTLNDANDQFSGGYVKTDRRPYDKVVVAMLCRIHHRLPAYFNIKFGGDVADWEVGYRLAVHALGEPFKIADLFKTSEKEHSAALALENEVRLPYDRVRAGLEEAPEHMRPARRRARP